MTPRPDPWVTPGLVACLLDLADDPHLDRDQIASMINEKFGLTLTRNSIIGKLWRLRKGAERRARRALSPPPPSPELKPMSEPKQENTPPPGIDILELTDEHCRFPVGEWPNIRYCGCQRFIRSYCAEHYAKAYIPDKTTLRCTRPGNFQKPAAR